MGSSTRLKNCKSLFACITNSMKSPDNANAREHDYEDEHDKQPDGIHVPILAIAPGSAHRGTASETGLFVLAPS